MRKGILLGIVFLLCISLVSAVDECNEEVYPSTACLILSPAGMTCTTYSIYDPTGTKIVNNVAMTELTSTSGVYYATFNYAPLGAYSIVLCDNTTAQLTVMNRTSSDPLYNYANDIRNIVNTLNSTTININTTIMDMNGTYQYSLNDINATVKDTNKKVTQMNNTVEGMDDFVRSELNNTNWIYTFLFIVSFVLIALGYYMDDKFFPMFAGFIIIAIGIYSAQFGFYGLNDALINKVVLLTCIGLGGYLIIKPMLDLLEGSK